MLTLSVTFLQDDITRMLGGVCDEIGSVGEATLKL